MGASWGIGAASGRRVSVPPTNPGNGSGGAGVLAPAAAGGRAVATSVRSDVSDLTAGRITLGLVELTVVSLIAFYLWTRSQQGG